MKIDLTKLNLEKSSKKLIEPRQIFLSLKNRDEKFRLPYDVQTQVWNEWYAKRDEKDTILKINTGGGKTLVALMMLQSCLNEQVGPAFYVVPDNYLAEQVEAEAKKLGINVIVASGEAKYDSAISSNKAIGILTIHTLFNGRSAFLDRIPIGSIVIDDVHACMRTAEEQFTVSIKRKEEDYATLFKMFKDELKFQRPGNFIDIEEGTANTTIQVPYWSWNEKLDSVRKLLNAETYKFNYPLIKSNLELCTCIFSTEKIEISPRFIPTEVIKSFEHARRRIFMSATLFDDTVFSTTFHVQNIDKIKIITPASANDLGERLILAPNAIDPALRVEDIKAKLAEYAKQYNVIVLVPSDYKAKSWSDVANDIVDKDNISEIVARLKNQEHLGMLVFKNRYDGVDLNDDACRILVLDGLPQVAREFDKIEKSAVYGSERILTQQMQKLEQGMGRGVRSNLDYCAVLLLTNEIAQTISIPKNKEKFSNATRAQIDLCAQITDDFSIETLDEMFQLVDLVLSRDDAWTSKSNEALANQTYNKDIHLDLHVIALKHAFDLAKNYQYLEAYHALQTYINKTVFDSNYLKGFMLQYAAELRYFSDQIDSQTVLKAAVKLNNQILKPQDGFVPVHKHKEYQIQASNILQYCTSNRLTEHMYLSRLCAVIEKLKFEQNNANDFEENFCQLGSLLGFESSRPEKVDNGPDVMWRLSGKKYLIVSCKNGAVTDKLSRSYADGLSGHINWFKDQFKETGNCLPLIIFPTTQISKDAFLPEGAQILCKEKLSDFHNALKEFGKRVVSKGLNETNLSDALCHFKLNGAEVFYHYSQTGKKESA